MTRAFAWASLLLAMRAWAQVMFQTGCADACGDEVIVENSTALCEIVIGNDDPAGEPIIVQDARYVVHHMDGNEVVSAAGLPLRLEPGMSSGAIPVTINYHAGDNLLPGGVISLDAEADLDFLYPSGTVSTTQSFPDRLTVIATSMCALSTTTTVPRETTTTVTEPPPETTTTTVPSRPECRHSHGHGAGLLRKCP